MPETHAKTTSETDGKNAQTDTLYYDGQCPLCASEIEELRNVRGSDLHLVDIHTLDATDPIASSKEPGHDRDSLLRTLHLQRRDGQWLTGADANVAAWEGTGRGRLLAVLRWPLLRYPVDLVYSLWARWRYRRLYGAPRSTADSHRAAP